MESRTLTNTVLLDALKRYGKTPQKEYRLWDGGTDGVRGFGIRVKPSGTRSFFYQYTSPTLHKKRRITIGQYPAIQIKFAREAAQKYAVRVLNGEDPLETNRLEEGPQTVSELCDLYLDRARKGLILYRGQPKKTSTIQTDAGRIERHIKPVLGKRRLNEVRQSHVEVFRDKIAAGETAATVKTGLRGLARVTGGHGAATRAIELLGSIFSFAIRNAYMEGENPVKGVEKSRSVSNDRYLRPDEYKAFADALGAMEREGKNAPALKAFRLLALTGARRNEIFELKPHEVQLTESYFEFDDTKTGKQRRAFGKAAAKLLADTMNESADRTYLFPGARPGTHTQNTKLFRAVCQRAKLKGVTPHILRHSFSTVAGKLNYAEVTIGALLGHSGTTVTSRYTHPVDDAIISAADKVSQTIAGYMKNGAKPQIAKVVEFPSEKVRG
ncbi:MAG: integrase [Paracoccaceae bacterium]